MYIYIYICLIYPSWVVFLHDCPRQTVVDFPRAKGLIVLIVQAILLALALPEGSLLEVS